MLEVNPLTCLKQIRHPDPHLRTNIRCGQGGGIAQWLAFALPDPAAPGSNPGVPDIYSEKKKHFQRKIVDVA